MTATLMDHLPLNGLKVLDLSRVLAGPLCTMILGDLGADVIKVERPGRGDDTRGWGPPFDARGESAYFLSINRNKLSIAADLRHAADRVVVERLMEHADVVVENFLPETRQGLGLDPEAAMRANRRLVWCSISGFGPSSSRPGYDFVVQAESGWMAATGEPSGTPMKTGVALADVVAGRDAAVSILAALLGRDREGTSSRHVHVSLVDSARSALVNVAQNALVTGVEPRRWGNAHANLVPYQLFRARDRAIVIAVGSDAQWQASAAVLGLADLASDMGLATNEGRVRQRDRIVSRIAEVLAGDDAEHWLEALREAGVPCGSVKTVLEAVEGATAASPLSGLPSSVGGETRLPPPRLDEHGSSIRQHGWAAFGVTG